MVDDSIVRGTTMKNIVKMLKDAGAKEVHVRISSPPFLWPCYFGTDIPNRDMLIACKYTIEEIRQSIAADTLGFVSCEALKTIAKDSNLEFCDACFTGKYPMEVPIMKEMEGNK